MNQIGTIKPIDSQRTIVVSRRERFGISHCGNCRQHKGEMHSNIQASGAIFLQDDLRAQL